MTIEVLTKIFDYSRDSFRKLNEEKATIIKTLGGQIEEVDKNSSREALIREVLEEVKELKKSRTMKKKLTLQEEIMKNV